MTVAKNPESQQERNLGCGRSHMDENGCGWGFMGVVGCKCTRAQRNKVSRGKNGQVGCGRQCRHTQKRRKQSRMIAVTREDHEGGQWRGNKGFLGIICIYITKGIPYMYAPADGGPKRQNKHLNLVQTSAKQAQTTTVCNEEKKTLRKVATPQNELLFPKKMSSQTRKTKRSKSRRRLIA